MVGAEQQQALHEGIGIAGERRTRGGQQRTERRRRALAQFTVRLRDQHGRKLAALDRVGRHEDHAVALIERGLPYLKPVWDGPGWQLFEVAGAAEDGGRRLVAGGGARVTALRPDSFTLRAPRPGTYLARVRWSSYWTPRGAPACLERDGEWTRVELERRGELEVVARLSLRGVLGADRVCSA